MSSLGSPSLEIERSARSQFTVVGLVLAILAITPWWLPHLSVVMAMLLAFITCGVACFCFWRIGWLGGRRRLHKALWTSEGAWQLVDRTGASWEATLQPSSQVLGTLLWLRFTSARGPRELLLHAADLPLDLRRRLVARLRLQGGESGARPSDLP